MELPMASSSPRLFLGSSAAVRGALGLAVFSLVASLVALAVILTRPHPQEDEKPPQVSPSLSPPSRRGANPQPSKWNYAQLVLKLESSAIEGRQLDWYTSENMKGVFFGSEFEYRDKSLKVKLGGLYCIYAQLNITHRPGSNSEKNAVNASLVIYRHPNNNSGAYPVLTLSLNLSHHSNKTVTPFEAVRYRLKKDDRLHVTINASKNARNYGYLNGRHSIFGLFQLSDT